MKPDGFVDAATNDAALEALTIRLLDLGGRVLLLGPPGVGKSTLAGRLGASLHRRGPAPLCIGADPGSPSFGGPGAVCLGEWRVDAWHVAALEALCSLDAGRFRLPLTACVRRLAPKTLAGPLIVDGPGVVRGVAGAELLPALVDAANIDAVISLQRAQYQPLLEGELRALGLPVLSVTVADRARRPGKPARARMRTRLWDAYLEEAGIQMLDLSSTPILGTPPPLEAREQWRGRLAALVGPHGQTAGFGEIGELEDGRLHLRCHRSPEPDHALLVRDARRQANGMLGTAGPDDADAVRYVAPADMLTGAQSVIGPRPVVRAGPVTAVLVNGVLGDPLLHVRLHYRRRSLLFDLGETGRLPAKIAHQVSDVFLSHAHMDHIAGFLWLTRSRLGDFPPLRVFGPPGIAENVRGLLAGILWDRIEARGPRFEVAEFDGERLMRTAIQGGGAAQAQEERPAPGGLLVEEPELRVRATSLDHGYGTRVLAFTLETPLTLKVRKERLGVSNLAPGPWLTRLKTLIAADDRTAPVLLPDGREVSAGMLADDLLLEAPGLKLAYATDLADTEQNRRGLARLSAGAHTLFCEACFRIADEQQARRMGHLTTRACGEIAHLAGAERLVPFHFSRRYENDLAPVYDEIRAAFSRTITPPLRDTED